MRKIALADYETSIGPFQVRQSLAEVLFSEPKLGPREVIARDELAKKIEACTEDYILLEDADYAKIITGLNSSDLAPLGRHVVEFIRRVLDAPVVEVTEKP